MLEDIKNIKSGKRELREFGVVIGAILIAIGDIALWRGKASALCFLGAGIIFFGLGLFIPSALKQVQRAWMALGLAMGFFVSRLILSLLFYAVITPIGLTMKLFGKDMLDERIDKNKPSYWHPRAAQEMPRESYENQY
ncbi:MAG: hypothetical protein JW919_00955 [Candidatus Omnitrophica bacterium]|nr:hypothetical protein [Candidatus Omnitrophota bacterium]